MTYVVHILDHVVSWASNDPKRWKQVMDNCQELACLTNIANQTMIVIIWWQSFGEPWVSNPSLQFNKHIWVLMNYLYKQSYLGHDI
jgi:hypothetical protein